MKVLGPYIMVYIILTCYLTTSFGQDSSDEDNWKSLILSEDKRERAKGKNMVIEEYNNTVTSLLSVLKEPIKKYEEFYYTKTSRNIAIELLGKLRAKRAVPELINWLLPKKGQSPQSDALFTECGPAGFALREIGLPAVPHLLEKLKEEGASGLGNECLEVIVDIKGKEETNLLLKNELERETDAGIKHNINEALIELGRLEPKLRKERASRHLQRAQKTIVQELKQLRENEIQLQPKSETAKPIEKERPEPADEGTDWLVVVLAIAVVVLAGAVVFLLLRRNKLKTG